MAPVPKLVHFKSYFTGTAPMSLKNYENWRWNIYFILIHCIESCIYPHFLIQSDDSLPSSFSLNGDDNEVKNKLAELMRELDSAKESLRNKEKQLQKKSRSWQVPNELVKLLQVRWFGISVFHRRDGAQIEIKYFRPRTQLKRVFSKRNGNRFKRMWNRQSHKYERD